MLKRINYMFPPFFTISIILLIYWVKGIYPFGINTVLKNDFIQFFSPMHHYLFDILHGKTSLLYNFQSFGGMNFWGDFTTNMTSPFNLILLFFKRNQIQYAESIIILLKISLCSLTAYLFLRKTFPKLSFFWSNLLSLSFAFSGYILISYPVLYWLDIVALFPLLVLSLVHLVKTNQVTYYIITLSIMIILGWYLTFIVLLFILFSSYLYLRFYVLKTKRSKLIRLLGIGTVISVLITLPISFPALIQAQTSARVTSTYFLGFNMLGSDVKALSLKISYFLMSSLPASFLLLMLSHPKKDKRFIWFLLSLLLLTLVPVLIEPINKMWHLGSYLGFPLRFGFIPIFLMIVASAYFLQSYVPTSEKSQKLTLFRTFTLPLIGLLLFLTIQAIFRHFNYLNDHYSNVIIDISATMVLFYWFFFFTWIYVTLWQTGSQTKQFRLFRSLILLVFFIQLFTSSFLFIGSGTSQKPTNQEYQDLSIIHQEFSEEKDFFRFKDTDTLFHSNYSWIAGVHSLSGFTNLANRNSYQLMKRLGYAVYRVRTMDKGGTLFTDYLYNVKYVIKQKETNDPSLILLSKKDHFNIYQSKYFAPMGLLIQNDINLKNLPTASNQFHMQNIIFSSLSGYPEKLFTTYPFGEIKKLDQYYYLQQTIPIQKKRRIYLAQVLKSNTKDINQVTVMVNGQLLQTDVINELLRNERKPTNLINLYPSPFNNGLLDLGEFENKTVTVSLMLQDKIPLDNFFIGSMNVSLFDSYYQSRMDTPIDLDIKSNKVLIKAKIEDDNHLLLLTLPYDNGWIITNRGKRIKPVAVFGSLIGIPLAKGANEIKMTYIPSKLKESVLISFLTLIFCAILYILNKNHKLPQPSTRMNNLFSAVYYTILTVATLLVYIIPFLISIL